MKKNFTACFMALMVVFVAGCGSNGGGSPGTGLGPTGGVCAGANCVPLGTAGNYVILAKTAVSTTGTTAVVGNIGLSPAATSYLTGFSLTMVGTTSATSPQVTGSLSGADMTAPTSSELTTAVSDMEIAYTAAAGKPGGACPGAGIMSGLTITPGVYTCANGVTIPTSITLNGSATDVWVFQFAQGLTQSAATQVILAGGALPKNVFWQVAGAVDIGTTALMQGVILGQTAINLQTGATVNGRLLAQTAVDLDATTVTQP